MDRSKQSRWQGFTHFLVSRHFCFALIGLGILLRLKHYLENRSFWVDEAYVAVSIVSRSWQEIIKHIPLFQHQPKLPLGFLLIEKSFVTLFGNHEMALRFFPFVCGIASLFLFYFLLKRHGSGPGVRVFALALFAVGEPLVYYAAELKQYSCDLCVALILFLILGNLGKEPIFLRRSCNVGMLGAFLMWMSNTSLFILASFGLIQVVGVCLRKQAKMLLAYMPAYLWWLASFCVLYFVSLRHMVSTQELTVMWRYFFMPLPFSWESVVWIKDVWLRMFYSPVGLSFPYLTAFIFIIGCVALYKRDQRSLCFYLLPIIFVLSAAMLHRYPFRGRMLLFLMPGILILLAEGILFVFSRTRYTKGVVGAGLVLVLLYQPVVTAGYYLVHPHCKQVHHVCREESRPVLRYLKKHYQPGDELFFNFSAQFPFWYYVGSLKMYEKIPYRYLGDYQGQILQGYTIGQFYEGVELWDGLPYARLRYQHDAYTEHGFFRRTAYDEELTPVFANGALLKGKLQGVARAWVVFIHDDPRGSNLVLKAFDQLGQRVRAEVREGAAVYLYEFHQR